MSDSKPEPFSKEIEEFLDKNVSAETKEMLANFVCEEHDKKITLTLKDGNLDINACCEEFAKIIQKNYIELESKTS
ncbi:MAG: hypothetical protein GY750_11650 [Lentisphaerae bacterium]|nr:hypothetical protein [Lentisphaerota bacterium]MCP4102069.1 hypothetical protein [Lentisphaerota bacterium]